MPELIALLEDDTRLCDDCFHDPQRDPADYGPYLVRWETGICDYHPEEDIITRKEREALDAQEAEESIRNTSHEALREEIERLRRQRGLLKEATFGVRYGYVAPLGGKPVRHPLSDAAWNAVYRLGSRLHWLTTHPFAPDLVSVTETNS